MDILDAAGDSINRPAEQTPAPIAPIPPIDDGGPAFPTLDHTESGFPWSDHDGMSLRAFAAVHAMEGLLAGWQPGDMAGIRSKLKPGQDSRDFVANAAVEYADALIARLKQGGSS